MPFVVIDRLAKVARFKVAYVSPADSKKCPATRSLIQLHHQLRKYGPTDLHAAVPSDSGDRTLSFDVDLPVLDLGPFKARAEVCCVSGACYSRETRRGLLENVSSIVFVPSLFPDCVEDTIASYAHLLEDLRQLDTEPQQIPLVVQWLLWGRGSDTSVRERLSPRLSAPGRLEFVSDLVIPERFFEDDLKRLAGRALRWLLARESGSKRHDPDETSDIDAAFFAALRLARSAHLDEAP